MLAAGFKKCKRECVYASEIVSNQRTLHPSEKVVVCSQFLLMSAGIAQYMYHSQATFAVPQQLLNSMEAGSSISFSRTPYADFLHTVGHAGKCPREA